MRVAVRRLDAGLAVAATLGPDRVAVLVVDVGLAVGDQQLGPLVELLEVVARVERVAELVAEPPHVGDDALDERRLLGVGVGVVETQVAHAAELGGEVEVGGDRLGVADVQVAVGFGRETGLHPIEHAVVEVVLHQLANEVGARSVVAGSDRASLMACTSMEADARNAVRER